MRAFVSRYICLYIVTSFSSCTRSYAIIVLLAASPSIASAIRMKLVLPSVWVDTSAAISV